VLVLDEISMVDCDLLEAVRTACALGWKPGVWVVVVTVSAGLRPLPFGWRLLPFGHHKLGRGRGQQQPAATALSFLVWPVTPAFVCRLASVLQVDYLARYMRGWRIWGHSLFEGHIVHELHPLPFGGLQVRG
jgi:hypothetical protein